MSTIGNGGPAFPVSTRPLENEPGFGHQDGPSTWQYGGMSLRDYAAIKAMQALISHYGDVIHIVDGDSRISLHAAAFDHADAFLKARK